MVDSAAPFTWQGAGASVFGATARGAAGDDDAADDDVERPPDVEFEPIVSLPEVEVVTGEEDEKVRHQILCLAFMRTPLSLDQDYPCGHDLVT